MTGIAILLAARCHSQPPRRDTNVPTKAPAPAGITATGTVRVVGADPSTLVLLDVADGNRWTLVGRAAPELAQLAGATVRVDGVNAATPPPDTNGISVQSYDILEIGGAKPIVGRLQSRGDFFFVDTNRISNVPPELVTAVGAKVWVAGRPGPSGLIVTAYGILASARADSTHH